MKQIIFVPAILSLGFYLAAPAIAQTATMATAPATTAPAAAAPATQPVDPVEQWIQKTKKPVSWFQWGADLRLRDEFLENNKTLDKHDPNHEVNYGRFRTRAWATISPTKDIDVNTRVAWEFRTYSAPKGPLREVDLGDAIVDNLNVQWRNFLNLPLTMTIGRQDITNLGNGWLIFEGTPLDGSRTIFFDAVRGTWEIKDAKTTVDAIYLNDGARENRLIEPFNYHNHDPRYLAEQNEQGAILWVANKSIKNTEIDGFFIYKNDQRPDKDEFPPTGETGEIYTFGARAAGDIDEHWKYRGEIAPQFGHKNGQSLAALGANTRLSYFVNDKLNNNFRMIYEFLSGDDPSTKSTNEGFDPLWGRYPQFSEILANTVAMETGRPAFWTNMHRFGPGWSFNPTKKMEVLTDYYLLFADENIPDRAEFSENGLFRGQLLSFLVKYTFNQHVKTHFIAEVFGPGNFYSKANNDTAVFLRYEIYLTW